MAAARIENLCLQSQHIKDLKELYYDLMEAIKVCFNLDKIPGITIQADSSNIAITLPEKTYTNMEHEGEDSTYIDAIHISLIEAIANIRGLSDILGISVIADKKYFSIWLPGGVFRELDMSQMPDYTRHPDESLFLASASSDGSTSSIASSGEDAEKYPYDDEGSVFSRSTSADLRIEYNDGNLADAESSEGGASREALGSDSDRVTEL